jgi:hypothetical protein
MQAEHYFVLETPTSKLLYREMYLSAMFSQLYVLTACEAACDNFLLRTASPHNLRITSARDLGSPDLNNRPVKPSDRISWKLSMFEVMTGTPEAIASSTTMPKPSNLDGKTQISVAL